MHPRTTARRPAHRPGRQLSLRILTEDPLLVRADLALPGTDVEVVVCDGPCVGEACPLLVDGTCPLGRFEAVVTALIERGVAYQRLYAVGYGESLPVADNDTAAGKRANRRIGFSIVDSAD